jgi:tRNA-dihydrouridine synthase B
MRAHYRGEPALVEPSPDERTRTILRHLEAHLAHVGDALRAIRKFRQHLIWYSRGLVGGSAFRERATRIEGVEETRDAILSFFSDARAHLEDEAPIYDERAAFG